jgi:hypothetical protein
VVVFVIPMNIGMNIRANIDVNIRPAVRAMVVTMNVFYHSRARGGRWVGSGRRRGGLRAAAEGQTENRQAGRRQ